MRHHKGEHGRFEEVYGQRDEYAPSPLRVFIRRNRKKILFGIVAVIIAVLVIVLLIGYFIFSLVTSKAGKIINQNTLNQAQKIASDSAQLIPPDLKNNELLQNFSWIINIINTLKNIGG